MEDETKINTHINPRNQTANIEIVLRDLYSLSSKKQIEEYLNQLIANTLKLMIMKEHNTLQDIVYEIINSYETRELVRSEIKAQMQVAVDRHIKDMFGKL